MKRIFIIVVIIFLIVVSFFVFKKYTQDNKNNNLNNEEVNIEVNKEKTVVKVEVKEGDTQINDGAVYVYFSDGNSKKIAESKGFKEVEIPYDIVSYKKSFISEDKKYVAIEANAFEESFVEIYEVSTDILHKRTYGVVTGWTNDGLLEVRECDLPGEVCNDKISINNSEPWIFKYKNGVSFGGDVLLDSTDIISNVKNSKKLSIFAKMLDAVGAEAINGTGPFTVFVPNNEAFEELDQNDVNNFFLEKNKQKLINFIRNHIVPNEYNTVEIKNNMKIKTIGNDTLSFTTNEWSYIKINGDSIVTIPNIYSTNGIIQIINKVIVK